MRDLPGLPSGSILGYCTNVHAGATLEEIESNLKRYSLAVKAKVAPATTMGIGLWIPADAVHELHRSVAGVGDWLDHHGLNVFTFNGFPFSNFHQDVVKHAVYEPSWNDIARWEYTTELASILAQLAEPGSTRGISTLPIAWGSFRSFDSSRSAAGLLTTANILSRLYDEFEVLVHLDVEPEPGCVLQRSEDIVRFFKSIFTNDRDGTIRRHLRVCHDICHAAVMFEDQAEMFARYKAAGIQIGKVQISNAIRVPFDEYSESDRREALQQLSAFAEDRYLHQTMIRLDDGRTQFFDDLPKAIQAVPDNQTARGEWRVHFHVPVYLESFGLLKTTRDHILECMRLLKNSEVKHWEVETYAWNVLPKELQVPDLAEGIANELLWVKEQAAKIA